MHGAAALIAAGVPGNRGLSRARNSPSATAAISLTRPRGHHCDTHKPRRLSAGLSARFSRTPSEVVAKTLRRTGGVGGGTPKTVADVGGCARVFFVLGIAMSAGSRWGWQSEFAAFLAVGLVCNAALAASPSGPYRSRARSYWDQRLESLLLSPDPYASW